MSKDKCTSSRPRRPDEVSSKVRRRLLTGGIAAGAALPLCPDRWMRPVVESVVLPAHAQTSCVTTGSRTPGLAIPDAPDDECPTTNGTPVIDSLILSNPCGSCRIAEVRVSLDITHTYRGDLFITLTSPSGTVHVLHNGTGGGANNVRFTDRVVTAFNGEPGAGTWTLFIQDQCSEDVGTLNSWSLSVSCV